MNENDIVGNVKQFAIMFGEARRVQIEDKKSLREGQELGDLKSEGMEEALFCLYSPK